MAVILEKIPLFEDYTVEQIKHMEDQLTGTFPQLASLLPRMIKDVFVGGDKDPQLTKIVQSFEKPVPVQVNVYASTIVNAFATPFVYGKKGVLIANFPLVTLVALGRMLFTWGFKFNIQGRKIVCSNVPPEMMFQLYYSIAMRKILEDDQKLLTAVMLHQLANCVTTSSFLRIPTALSIVTGGSFAVTQPFVGGDIQWKLITPAVSLVFAMSVILTIMMARFIRTPASDAIVKQLGYGQELAIVLDRVQNYVPASSRIWFRAIRTIDVIGQKILEYANRLVPLMSRPSNLARQAALTDTQLSGFWKLTTFFDRAAAKIMQQFISHKNG